MRNRLQATTRRHSPALLLLLTIGALVLAPATDSFARPSSRSSWQDAGSGRLLLKYSVTLGINVALSVTIDGQEAGVFTKGHRFAVAIPAGSHVVSVHANGQVFDYWTGRLDVQPGQTYSYVVKYNGAHVVLAPIG